MSTITLTVAQCKALLLHIPKSDIRHYLVGLHVAPDGIVSATDGHRALRVQAEVDGPCAEGIIPRELVELACKCRLPAVFFTLADGRATLTPGGQSMPLVDGEFPDVARVCPMQNAGAIHDHKGTFNLLYQLDARKALDLLTRGSPSKLAPLAVKWKTDQEDPLSTAFCHGEGFAMVIKPVRE